MPDAPARRFVVQRHRARRLHYDLRFEVDGVLVSWAVPRGPTLDPTARRQAVHVDDHPMEYLLFEGVIPAGTYGGGDVIVWDEGTWEPHGTDDPAAAVAGGELHAEVHGHKLRGRLVLVRRDRAATGGQEQWLLLHKRDEHAVEGWEPEEHPRSVLSGRTNEDVARDPDRLWRSDLPAERASVALRPEAVPSADPRALDRVGPSGTWDVYGHRIRLTGLDDVLLRGRRGAPRVTRRDLVAYAARIAPTVLPYLTARPLVMVTRRPGRTQVSVRRHLADRGPDWLPRRRDPRAPGSGVDVLVVDEPAALVWAAARGAVEWRPWLSPAEAPDLPTHAVLAVGGGSWGEAVALAGLCRAALDHLGLRGHPVVTARGIEVRVPLRPGPRAATVRRWSDGLAAAVAAVAADADGGGRRRRPVVSAVDPAEAVPPAAPYSPYAEPGAPVAWPVTWEELDDPAVRPGAVTVREAPARLRERGDIFAAALVLDQDLPRLS